MANQKHPAVLIWPGVDERQQAGKILQVDAGIFGDGRNVQIKTVRQQAGGCRGTGRMAANDMIRF